MCTSRRAEPEFVLQQTNARGVFSEGHCKRVTVNFKLSDLGVLVAGDCIKLRLGEAE